MNSHSTSSPCFSLLQTQQPLLGISRAFLFLGLFLVLPMIWMTVLPPNLTISRPPHPKAAPHRSSVTDSFLKGPGGGQSPWCLKSVLTWRKDLFVKLTLLKQFPREIWAGWGRDWVCFPSLPFRQGWVNEWSRGTPTCLTRRKRNQQELVSEEGSPEIAWASL